MLKVSPSENFFMRLKKENWSISSVIKRLNPPDYTVALLFLIDRKALKTLGYFDDMLFKNL